MKAILWLIFMYATLKVAGIVFAKSAGFGRSALSLRDRLRAGEPMLFISAFMLSVPLALLTSWYSHATLTGMFERSTDCYGRVVALRHLPAVTRGVDGYTVYESVQDFRATSFAMAANLGMTTGDVDRILARKVAVFADQYAAMRRLAVHRRTQEQIDRAKACLHPPPEAPNA